MSPLGSTNGTVGTWVPKMPVVGKFGLEMGAQKIWRVTQNSNYSGWMTAKTDDEYYRIAKRLIDERFSGKNLTMHPDKITHRMK